MALERVRKGKNYVNNAELFEGFKQWYADSAIAKEKGLPEPQPPRVISEAILLIPTKLATSGNFAGYSFKEEMIGDAIENILQYYRNFDPEKSQNPFAYLSQISYFAFLRRIMKEKKQAYIRHKIIQNSGMLDSIATQMQDSDADYTVSFLETLQMNLKPELEAAFERKAPIKEPPKKRGRKKDIEDLL